MKNSYKLQYIDGALGELYNKNQMMCVPSSRGLLWRELNNKEPGYKNGV